MLDYFKQKLTRIGVALITTLGLSSCVEMEQEYILNPDGSGKLKITQAIAMPNFGDFGTEKNNPQQQKNPLAKEMLIALLKAEGIEAWSDVKYEVGKDGKTRVQATGYFADVTKIMISGGMNENDKQGSGISKNNAGYWVLDLKESLAQAKEKQAATKEEESAPTLTEEEITAKIEEQRQQFAMQKAMMQAMFGTMKVTTTISGGGTIEEAKGAFVKKGDNSASFTITGASMIDAMSKIIEDDEMVKKMIQAGKNPLESSDPSELLATIGFSEDSKVVLKPTQPAFDYAAEVAAAKKNVSSELKQLLQEAEKDAEEEAKSVEKSSVEEKDE